jgi:hypothetical protein
MPALATTISVVVLLPGFGRVVICRWPSWRRPGEARAMLTLAAWLLGVAALAGLGLLALYQWVRPLGWWRLPGLGHGLAGLLGLAALLAALGGGPPRGVAMGAGSFGTVAGVLTGVAAALGVAGYVVRRRAPAAAQLAIGLHATFAVGGLTLLLAYLSYPG